MKKQQKTLIFHIDKVCNQYFPHSILAYKVRKLILIIINLLLFVVKTYPDFSCSKKNKLMPLFNISSVSYNKIKISIFYIHNIHLTVTKKQAPYRSKYY